MTAIGNYEAVTRDVRIRVAPQYAPDQSSPEGDRFMWLYTIEITNQGPRSVRLLSRFWKITDAIGKTQEVRGPGVIGQTPTIEPGESFTYTSGCPLETPSGIMVGSYKMESVDGDLFDVAIPAFSLDSPHTVRTVN